MKMLKLLIVMILVCGAIYPLTVTVIARVIFPEKAEGSLIHDGNKIIGSKLLSQKFEGQNFFHPRPSATDFGTLPSGATNFSVTSKKGMQSLEEKRSLLPDAGVDAWTSSASGLDPHISPQTARAQIPRVAAARELSAKMLEELIEKHTEGPSWGIWGQA